MAHESTHKPAAPLAVVVAPESGESVEATVPVEGLGEADASSVIVGSTVAGVGEAASSSSTAADDGGGVSLAEAGVRIEGVGVLFAAAGALVVEGTGEGVVGSSSASVVVGGAAASVADDEAAWFSKK